MCARSFVRVVVIGIATMAVAAPATAADPMAQRFARLSFGLTRQAVEALMETPPTSVSESSSFGIAKIRLKWVEGLRSPGYVVVLVAGRVISTESCDPNTEC